MLRKPLPAGVSKIQAVVNPLLNVGGPEAKFAVFQIATAQFRSSPGDVIRCPRIQAAIGSEVVLKKVLLLGGHRFTVVGRPFVEGAVVVADVEEQKRGQPVVHYRNPKMQKHMMWKEYHEEITVLRVKRIEFEPIIVGELDKYTGSLLPAEAFQADKPPNPIYSARSPILGDQHHVPRRRALSTRSVSSSSSFFGVPPPLKSEVDPNHNRMSDNEDNSQHRERTKSFTEEGTEAPPVPIRGEDHNQNDVSPSRQESRTSAQDKNKKRSPSSSSSSADSSEARQGRRSTQGPPAGEQDALVQHPSKSDVSATSPLSKTETSAFNSKTHSTVIDSEEPSRSSSHQTRQSTGGKAASRSQPSREETSNDASPPPQRRSAAKLSATRDEGPRTASTNVDLPPSADSTQSAVSMTNLDLFPEHQRQSQQQQSGQAVDVQTTKKRASLGPTGQPQGKKPAGQSSAGVAVSAQNYSDESTLLSDKSRNYRYSDVYGEPSVIAGVDGSAPKGKFTKVTDWLHRIFFYVSIPLAFVCAILNIVLYTTHHVHAVTVSHLVAGYCAFAASVLTVFLIFLHTTVYTNPKQQRLICRILIMVPIYAFDSWVALMAYKSATIIGLFRDTYEAYVIYMFFGLLMDYVGGEERIVGMWATDKPVMKHLFPFTHCLDPIALNSRTLLIWKRCLMQYVVLNPLLTLISVPLYYTGHYEEGVLEPGNGYLYIAFIRFVSVTFAFTSLVYFFFGCSDFIKHHKPLAKFAAIKSIVFLTFWQSVLLGALNHFKVIPSSELWTADQVTTGLNNFVICIEMFIISIAHRWCFPDTPYMPADGNRAGIKCWVLKHLFSISDVLEDANETLLTPVVSVTRKVVGSPKAAAEP